MRTIINTTTKKVEFCVADDNYVVQENQTMILELCTLDNPEEKEYYFNEETGEFYLV